MVERVLTPALAAAPAAPAFAQGEAFAPAVKKFETMYPKTTFKEVRKPQVSGLYGVVIGESIAYIDRSGCYFIFGHLFNMQQQADLTAQRRLGSKKTEFPVQQFGQTIKTVKGDGSRILAVFSDLDCPYCKQLEGELARLSNVAIHTFLYPFESLHPETKIRAVSMWCASSKAETWGELMLAGKKPKLVTCNNPVNDDLMLGSKLDVVNISTLIAVGDRILPGSAPAEKIDQWLNAGKPGASATAQEATQ